MSKRATSKVRDITTKGESSVLSSDAMSFLEEHAGEGFEDVGADDFVLPFIKKIEPLSKCLQKHHQNYIEGAEAGQLAHTVLKQTWDSIYMIPIKYDNMFQHYKFPEGTGGWIANYKFNSPELPPFSKVERDGKSFRVPTDTPDSYLQQTFNYIGLFFDPDMNPLGPAILPMEKSQCRVARQFNVLLNSKKISRSDGSTIKAPIFSHRYRISLQTTTNDKGTWHTFAYGPGEIVTDPELLREAYGLSQDLREVDTSTLHAEPESESGDEASTISADIEI